MTFRHSVDVLVLRIILATSWLVTVADQAGIRNWDPRVGTEHMHPEHMHPLDMANSMEV